MYKFFLQWLFIAACFFPLSSKSQQAGGSSAPAGEQAIEQKRDKKEIDADEAGRKRHLSIQSKKTRKRMKKSRKKARKNNENC